MEDLMLDTSFLILLLKEKKLSTFVRNYNGFLPDIVLFEYLRGEAYLDRDITREKSYLEDIFVIVILNNDIIIRASELWAKLIKKGVRIPEPDVLIAAYALEMDMPLITLDEDFQRLIPYGLKLADLEKVKNDIEID